MAMLSVFLSLVVLASAASSVEQVHIALTGDASQMVVQWTSATTGEATVQYGSAHGKYDLGAATGTSTRYTGNDGSYTSPYLFHATLEKLTPSNEVFYRIGDGQDVWSAEFTFVAAPEPGKAGNYILWGDTGCSSHAVDTIHRISQEPGITCTVHMGDIARPSEDHNLEKQWDKWGGMQQVISSMPVMPTFGNHEETDNQQGFLLRYSLPWQQSGAKSNCYYSFNWGMVHFISLSAFSNCAPFADNSEQHKWLEADLQKIDRAVTPWVHVYFHTPWYSTNKDHMGSGEDMRKSMEKLVFNAHVDIASAGHVHAYEHVTHVDNMKVNPAGPIHILSGNSGAGASCSWNSVEPWSVYRSCEYGYTRVEVINATHVYFQSKRNSDDKVFHDFYLTKNNAV